MSPVSACPSPLHITSSISTSSHEACTSHHDESCSSFDNSFNTAQWNTLASSAVDTFGDATVRFPPSAVPPTWGDGWVPDADPQSRPYPSVPLSTIQDELAIDEEQEGIETLLQLSRVPTTWQNLTLTTSAVRSQHKPASGSPKQSRRSTRNSKSTTYAGKHFSRAKHQTKTAAAYLYHTNDHLHPANSAPPSPLTHPTQQYSVAPAPILLRETREHHTIFSTSSIVHD